MLRCEKTPVHTSESIVCAVCLFCTHVFYLNKCKTSFKYFEKRFCLIWRLVRYFKKKTAQRNRISLQSKTACWEKGRSAVLFWKKYHFYNTTATRVKCVTTCCCGRGIGVRTCKLNDRKLIHLILIMTDYHDEATPYLSMTQHFTARVTLPLML